MSTRNGFVDDPHGKLAAMMSKDLGVAIDANALRLFVLHRWAAVTLYAHAIHDSEAPHSYVTATSGGVVAAGGAGGAGGNNGG